MRQATTPTHTFTLPFTTDLIATVRITYAQCGKVVLEKTESDCSFSGYKMVVSLTQEETLSFDENEFAKVQVRIITADGNSLVSNKLRFTVGDALNKEVLV